MTDRPHAHEHPPTHAHHGGSGNLMRGVGWFPWYDVVSWWAGMPAAYAELVARVDPQPGQRVLEIGCGTGNLLIRVLRKAKVTGIGLDPDPRSLRTLRRKAGRARTPVTTDVGQATALPYADASIDQVLSALMFHHLEPADRSRALAEVRRVLAPGGRLDLVDIDPDPSGPAPKMGARVAQHHVLDADLPATLRAAGFDVTSHPSLPSRFGPLVHLTGR